MANETHRNNLLSLAGIFDELIERCNFAFLFLQKNQRLRSMYPSSRFKSPSSSLLLSAVVLAASATLLTAAEDVVFEDFEGSGYGDWVAEGDAFTVNAQPVNYDTVSGFLGDKFVSSSESPAGDSTAVGSLTSPEFVISHDYIHFLASGDMNFGGTRVRLIEASSGSELYKSTGHNNVQFRQDKWNVTSYIGLTVYIEIEDKSAVPGVHMNVDHIVFSDDAFLPLYEEDFKVELWRNIYGEYDVEGLVQSDEFYAEPDAVGHSSNRFTLSEYDSGVRMRGYITAPVSGKYNFWVSASTSAELWLSSDETKFQKRRIAYLGSTHGSGTDGVAFLRANPWDQYIFQMSDEVYLEAGQAYFVETLSQQFDAPPSWRHISLAWSLPDSDDRELIPSQYLTPYTLSGDEAGDSDDDSLPDDWEQTYGLNIADNGLVDRLREGERADFDGDSLSNHTEYLLGTNPANSDSDGDGYSDFDEINSFGTDPQVSDAPSLQLVDSFDLSAFSSDTADWAVTSQGLISSIYRGDISWSFDVPSDGYWALNVYTKLLGDLYLNENVRFYVSINGQPYPAIDLAYGSQNEATLNVLTPYLPAGLHHVNIEIDNVAARRTVSITGVELLKPTGLALEDGETPDWILDKVSEENKLNAYTFNSATSPASVEGFSRFPASVAIDGSPVQEGLDDNHWFSNVSLLQDGETEFSVQHGAYFTETAAIEWAATNVLQEDSITIRKGDSLKLVAQPVHTAENLIPVLNATASQSTTGFGGVAARAIDGNTAGAWAVGTTTHTANKSNSWWQVDLGEDCNISAVKLWNRTNGNLGRRLSNYRISVLDSLGNVIESQEFHTDGSSYSVQTELWTLPSTVSGRAVKVEKLGRGTSNSYVISLAEVEVHGHIEPEGQSYTITSPVINWSQSEGVTASQSTTGFGGAAARAIDGNTNGAWGAGTTTHTANKSNSWWQADLGADRYISEIKLWNRTDGTLGRRLSNYRVSIYDATGAVLLSQEFHTEGTYSAQTETWTLPHTVLGRGVLVEKLGRGAANKYILALAEVEILLGGVQAVTTNSQHTIHHFSKAGEYTISASHSDGSTNDMTVFVKQAEFSNIAHDVLVDQSAVITLPSDRVDSDLHFDGGDSLILDLLSNPIDGEFTLTADASNRGKLKFVARLYEDGPILNSEPINVIKISGTSENDLITSYNSNDFIGSKVITTPLYIDDLPEGAYLEVRVVRNGASFLDGSTTLILTAEDFKEGVYYLKFLFSRGMEGGYCHTIFIYDRDGDYLGFR